MNACDNGGERDVNEAMRDGGPAECGSQDGVECDSQGALDLCSAKFAQQLFINKQLRVAHSVNCAKGLSLPALHGSCFHGPCSDASYHANATRRAIKTRTARLAPLPDRDRAPGRTQGRAPMAVPALLARQQSRHRHRSTALSATRSTITIWQRS